MKRFNFNIQLSGVGDNAQDAWLDACNAFAEDSGIYPEDYETEDLYDGEVA